MDLHLNYGPDDPDATAALERYLRLFAADRGGLDGPELTEVVHEVLEGAELDEQALRRLAWLLHVSALAGAVLAEMLVRGPDFEGLELDPQEVLGAVGEVMESTLRGEEPETK